MNTEYLPTLLTSSLLANRYRVVRPIGQGATARVYLALDCAHHDRQVVLKVVPAVVAESLAWQFRVLRQLAGPGLMGVIELLQTEGEARDGDAGSSRLAVLVCEFVNGRPASRSAEALQLQPGRRLELALSVGAQVANALAVVHAHGRVHGDVKPENILMDEHGVATVIDFGASRSFGTFGDVFGTPGFLSPEACAGVVDPRGDFYALGVTVCSLINGVTSGAGARESATESAHRVRGVFRATPLIPGGLPGGVSKLLSELLQHDLTGRPADGASLCNRFVDLYRDQMGAEPPGMSSRHPAYEVVMGVPSPTVVPCVGQARQRDELAAHLQSGAELVQIVGPPGSGRTRLIRDTVAELQVSAIGQSGKAFSFCSYTQVPDTGPKFDSVLHLVLTGASQRLSDLQSLILAARLRGVRVQVVLELAELLPAVPAIELRPLIEQEVVALLTACLGRTPHSAVCREVAHLTGGWAGRIYCLGALARDRELPLENTALWTDLALESVSNIARVPEECLPLVDLMVLCGGWMRHVAIGAGVVDADSQAGMLRRQGVAWVDEHGALSLHPAVVVSAAPLSGHRRERALNGIDRDQLSNRERAFVCLEEGAFDESVVLFEQIVRQEQARGRHDTLVGLLRRALARRCAVGHSSKSLSSLNVQRQLKLWLADSYRAQAQYSSARLELKGVCPVGPDEFHLVADIYRLAGDEGLAEEVARRALVAMGACEAVGNAHLSRLCLDRGDTQDAIGFAQRVLSGRAAGEQATCLALEVVAMASIQTENPAQVTCRLEEFLRWTQSGAVSSRSRYRGAATAAYVLSTLGDGKAAQGHNRRAVSLADVAGEVHSAAVSRINAGSSALAHGELAHALEELADGAAWLCRWGRDGEAWRALYNLAHARQVCGDTVGGQWVAEQAADHCESELGLGVVRSLQAELALASGSLGQAREWLEQCGLTPDAPPSVKAIVWGRMVEVACGLENLSLARRVCSELSSLSVQDAASSGARALSDDIRVETWVGQARVALLEGDAGRARDAVKQALPHVDDCAFELRLRVQLVRARAAPGGPQRQLALSEARRLLERASADLSSVDLATFRSCTAYQSAFTATLGTEGSSVEGALPGDSMPAASPADPRLILLAKRLLAERRTKRLFELVLDCAIELVAAERGYLMTTGQGVSPRLRAARGLARRTLPLDRGALSRSILGQVMASGRPVSTSNAATDVEFSGAESVHAMALKSVAVFPLSWDCEVRGVVYLEDRLRSHAFAEGHMQVLTEFFTLAGFAIEAAESLRSQRRTARRLLVAQLRLAKQVESQGQELRGLREQQPAPGSKFGLIGQAPEFLKVLSVASRVARSDLSVLIGGESGTGKELLARAIHEQSEYSAGPFVAENCGAVPEGLLESTLFGHVRGAFTGASRDRQGLFEMANGGTLFLDEVGEMPKGMQVRLLRVLQDGLVYRVGAERPSKVAVRVVAATHRDLPKAVERGDFREDLYYRLAVVALILPALRQRRGDIAELAIHFIAKYGSAGARFSARALTVLRNHHWPGNVRQLENEIRRALLLSEGKIETEHLSPELSAPVGAERHAESQGALDLHGQVAALEKRLVTAALQASAGNQSRAARELGVSRFGLQKMISRLRITIPGRPRSSAPK